MEYVIDGVILAAGRSTRMGRSKATLPVGGETFLAHAARSLRDAGCRRVLAVVSDAGTVDTKDVDVGVVVNPVADSEQIDSLRCALAELDDTTSAVLVLPVDVPLVTVATCAAVIAAYRTAPALLVVPVHRGEVGHPVLIARVLFEDIHHGEWVEGMRSVIMAHADDMQEVPVDDAGVLIDIDTPADYQRHIERQ